MGTLTNHSCCIYNNNTRHELKFNTLNLAIVEDLSSLYRTSILLYKYMYVAMVIAGYVCYCNALVPISSVNTRSQRADMVFLKYYFS